MILRCATCNDEYDHDEDGVYRKTCDCGSAVLVQTDEDIEQAKQAAQYARDLRSGKAKPRNAMETLIAVYPSADELMR